MLEYKKFIKGYILMELFISIIALIVSIAGFVFSIIMKNNAAMANQFQKLAIARLTLDELLWQLMYRLNEIENFYNKIPDSEQTIKKQYSDIIKKQSNFIENLKITENKLEQIYKLLKESSKVLPDEILESLIYDIKSIKLSVNVSREELIPILKKIEEDLKRYEEILDEVVKRN